MINKPRGTYDILPNESHKWQIIEKIIIDVMKKFNFKEIRTPIFERIELFKRSIGEETDIVSKEMYDFQDKKGRTFALRPEGTAPVMRAMTESKELHQNLPKKVFYMGQMFRYERPQKGRYRQFNQFGVEAIGSKNPLLDVEVISLAFSILKKLGVKNVLFKINNLGYTSTRSKYIKELSKYFSNFKDQLLPVSKERIEKNPLRIIDDKIENKKDFVINAPKIKEFLSEGEIEYFDKITTALDTLGIPYEIDETIVRGLDYYDGIVYELISLDENSGAQSTIFGGGRYNGLVEKIGGINVSGTGFGIGVERLMAQVEKDNPELLKKPGIDVFVAFESEEGEMFSHKLMNSLRENGISCETSYINYSINKQNKQSLKHDPKLLIAVGKKELDTNTLFIKNINTGEKYNLPMSDIKTIKEILKR